MERHRARQRQDRGRRFRIIRDDLDAEVDVDIASLIDTAVLATADLAEKDEGTDIEVDLYEKAGVDGDVGVVVDLSDIDA